MKTDKEFEKGLVDFEKILAYVANEVRKVNIYRLSQGKGPCYNSWTAVLAQKATIRLQIFVLVMYEIGIDFVELGYHCDFRYLIKLLLKYELVQVEQSSDKPEKLQIDYNGLNKLIAEYYRGCQEAEQKQ